MFKTLPGFREFYPQDCLFRDYIFEVWKKTALKYGFEIFDVPVLEPLELFTEKSGPEIKSQLFEFVDKGSREVSLRPEMTPSLARMVGNKGSSLPKPIKWFCYGENFRYERQQKGRLRAFYQFNADIMGEPSISGDAEIIALLIGILQNFGLSDKEFCVRLSDRKLWQIFLESMSVEKDKLMACLGVIDKMERLPEEAFEKLLIEAVSDEVLAKKCKEKIYEFSKLSSLEDVKTFFKNCQDGQNVSQEINEQINLRISQFEELFKYLKAFGISSYIKIDFTIVRGLAYYTGFVFEAFQIIGKGRALAGGGRYDDLVKKLGYQDCPAVGFGMGDVTLADLLELAGKKPSEYPSLDIYAIIASDKEKFIALENIAKLRSLGKKVSYSLKNQNFAKQFKTASSLNAKYAIIFAEEELSKNCVKIKNLSTSQEELVKLEDLETFFNF